LHGGDLLLCDVPPDTLELFQRYQSKQRKQWLQRLWSPLSLRFPLWNPDAFLDRWLFLVHPLFGWAGFLIWSGVVGAAVMLAASHWVDLSKDVADQVLAPNNLVVLFFVYPLVKFLHELGHAFSSKVWGGEVHEMGIMLLVFMPVPYVDASSSWGFRDKKKRAVVGAAGMIVEIFLAAIALFVWLNVEPGVVRSIAYNVMLIGGVSTIFFNGNPLLRFDGYYIFSDLIEVPNLVSRANNYLGYLFQRYIFGIKSVNSPVTAKGERAWFLIYGIASAVYRIVITFSIILFIAGKFFVIGVFFAIWAAATMIAVPLVKSFRFIFNSPLAQQNRVRTVTASMGLFVFVVGFIFLFPMPLSTYAEGVVWLPEQAIVRAKTDGFIKKILASPNSVVAQDQILIEMDDPILRSEQEVLNYQLAELQAKFKDVWSEDQVKAQIFEEQMKSVQAELDEVMEKIQNLTLKSASSGIIILPHSEDLPDRFLHKGDLVGYIVNYPITTVRGVVTQDNIGLVRERAKAVQIRLAENIKNLQPAKIIREVPAASDQLPSSALGTVGGGIIPVDPSEKKGERAYEPVFQIELAINSGIDARNIGERVYIRFDHGGEPLARQWYRVGRQLFLRKFSV
jgi:putative peptide zinc metalloprotease protein